MKLVRDPTFELLIDFTIINSAKRRCVFSVVLECFRPHKLLHAGDQGAHIFRGEVHPMGRLGFAHRHILTHGHIAREGRRIGG